jgi:prevent-host-death family protein
MVTINASEFKAKCLAILDRVADTGEPVVILKRGRPVAQLVPPISSESRYPQEELLGSVSITGDVIEPVLPADAWDALNEAEK